MSTIAFITTRKTYVFTHDEFRTMLGVPEDEYIVSVDREYPTQVKVTTGRNEK
jgi:hypothetical protein